ncbi:MAG: hypothetical protein REH83_02905 [Rickettsiella sp.]|nr:hypothetical protein [Rickettsiella sp.]
MKQVNINLLPWRKNQFKRKKIEFILFLSGMLILSLVSILSLNFLFSYQVKRLKLEKDRLIGQLASLSSSVEKTYQLKQHTEQLETTLHQLHINHKKIKKILELVNDIKLIAPSEFIIKNINYSASRLTIVGLPLSKNKFLQLKNKLEDKYHKKIKWNYIFKKKLNIEFVV